MGLDKIDIVADMAARPPSDLPITPPGTPPPTPEELIKAIYYVQLPKKGMGLDLSGVAKGFIIGRMVGRMREFGVKAALVQAGGDIYAIGEKPADPTKPGGDRRWGVGVQDPRFPDDPARLFTAIRVKDQAVTTSGHYYRGYTVEGKRFSHIVDPKTGRPVDNHIASVTVVATDPGVADALSTAVAVMGIEKGMAMIEELKDVQCLILEAATPEAGAPEPKPEDVRLIPHRSQGFAAMEYKPEAGPAKGSGALCVRLLTPSALGGGGGWHGHAPLRGHEHQAIAKHGHATARDHATPHNREGYPHCQFCP